jgi:hypothetical protein
MPVSRPVVSPEVHSAAVRCYVDQDHGKVVRIVHVLADGEQKIGSMVTMRAGRVTPVAVSDRGSCQGVEKSGGVDHRFPLT